jgi:hypothetical protein
VTIFNLIPLKTTPQIYFRNKCGTYQRVYLAIPGKSATHHSTSTLTSTSCRSKRPIPMAISRTRTKLAARKAAVQGILLSTDGLHANERLRSVRVLSHAHDPLSHGTSRNISLPRCQHLPVFRIFTSSICLVAGSTDCGLSGFGTLLSRSTHSAEKATEVSRQCDDDRRHSLDRQAISRQSLLVVLSGSPMNEPHHTDQET